MLLYFTKIYKKLRKNDKNDVFLCFIVFLLDFKKDLKNEKIYPTLANDKTTENAKVSCISRYFLDTLLLEGTQIIVVFWISLSY